MLRVVQDVVRRHLGRLRVTSERLHRFANDEHRWMGKTAYEIELPLPPRPPRSERDKDSPPPPKRRGGRRQGGRAGS